MGYLVLLGASRKRCPKSQTRGECTGSITFLLENVILCVTVSEKKWERAKEIICGLLEMFNDVDKFPGMSLKDMEQKTCYLLHLSMA